MNPESILQSPRVQITFSPLEGCTLKAVSLARDIRHCFEIPAQVLEKNDGAFEVTVNGVSIYRQEGACDPRESHEAIFMLLRKYKEPLRDLPVETADPEREADPKYRAWLRAMCSGE
ncbi:MAG: hypothetical protein M0009_01405 [Deltaproteobacteria bacterium]|nr:hypothetical protein [Deltaproteobacteria bacterium]